MRPVIKSAETAGKEIEDEELREAMKESGLGTPATRAAIIETLLTRKYIVREKKNLVPTETVYRFTRSSSPAYPRRLN